MDKMDRIGKYLEYAVITLQFIVGLFDKIVEIQTTNKKENEK